MQRYHTIFLFFLSTRALSCFVFLSLVCAARFLTYPNAMGGGSVPSPQPPLQLFANFLCKNRSARSPQTVAWEVRKTHFYQHSARSTPSIPGESRIGSSNKVIWPAFRARNAHDPRRGWHRKLPKHNFTSIPHGHHARSLQRVAWEVPKTAILSAYRARDAHDPCRP